MNGNTPALAEPVEIAKFWKNRNGELIRIALENYEGKNLLDVRVYFTAGDGRVCASKKGVSLSVLRLPELAAAINKALATAFDLGLIEKVGAGK
jgi:hypothetical protein